MRKSTPRVLPHTTSGSHRWKENPQQHWSFICPFLWQKHFRNSNLCYCSTCYWLLNEGIMCTRVQAKFAAEIMKEPESCSAQGYELIPQQQWGRSVLLMPSKTYTQQMCLDAFMLHMILQSLYRCANVFIPTDSTFHITTASLSFQQLIHSYIVQI